MFAPLLNSEGVEWEVTGDFNKPNHIFGGKTGLLIGLSNPLPLRLQLAEKLSIQQF